MASPARMAFQAVLNVAGFSLYIPVVATSGSTPLLIGASLVAAVLLSVPAPPQARAALVPSVKVGIAQSGWAKVLVNFVVAALFLSGIALALHNPAHISTGRKIVVGVAFGVPALIAVIITASVVRSLLRSPRTEFEAAVMTRTAALAFPLLAALAVGDSLAEAFGGAPRLEGWWVIVTFGGVASVVQNLVRRRMTR